VTVAGAKAMPPHRLPIDLMRSLVVNDPVTARAILEDERNDIAGLCAALDRWRLAGYVHTLIGDAGLSASLPELASHRLADHYRDQVQRCDAGLDLLRNVQRAMADASLPFLTMKGFYIAQRFLGGFRRRFMWDLDILVREEDLGEAIAAAARAGLRIQPGARFAYRRHFWGIHAVEARGKAGKIDIHHAIRKLPKIQLDHNSIWRNGQEFTLDGTQFPTLGDEDTLFTAAIGLSTDLQTTHLRLRKIWDIYMMLRAMDATTDWDVVFAKRQTEGSLKLVINALSFSTLLIGAKGDFPQLEKAMTRRRESVIITDERQAEAVYLRGRQNLANRVLFSRMLPASPLHYWLNWLISLPVRSWHFRKTKNRKHASSG